MPQAITQPPVPSPDFDRLAFARRILTIEAEAMQLVSQRLGHEFESAIETMFQCKGRIVVTGVGKSSDIGLKIVGTLNSTGTKACHLDATKALHGDLGMVSADDVALLLSHSGESEEIVRLLRPLRGLLSRLVAITSNASSSLARMSDIAIVYGAITEACPNSLAPSTSTTVMLALGDALALTLSELRHFTREDFARYHPAGSLGRKLSTVDRHMRTGDDLRTALASETVRAVFAKVRHAGRRSGAIILTHSDGTLAGLFTDSDLARLFEKHADHAFDRPISEVMTQTPTTVTPSVKLLEALELMRTRKISEVPVVDAKNCPVGMLDITDLIGIDPALGEGANRPSLRLFERANG